MPKRKDKIKTKGENIHYLELRVVHARAPVCNKRNANFNFQKNIKIENGREKRHFNKEK